MKEAIMHFLELLAKQKLADAVAWLKQKSTILLMKIVYGFFKARRKVIEWTPTMASIGLIVCLITLEWRGALICYGVALSALSARDSSKVVYWFKKWKFDDYPGKDQKS